MGWTEKKWPTSTTHFSKPVLSSNQNVYTPGFQLPTKCGTCDLLSIARIVSLEALLARCQNFALILRLVILASLSYFGSLPCFRDWPGLHVWRYRIHLRLLFDSAELFVSFDVDDLAVYNTCPKHSLTRLLKFRIFEPLLYSVRIEVIYVSALMTYGCDYSHFCYASDCAVLCSQLWIF